MTSAHEFLAMLRRKEVPRHVDLCSCVQLLPDWRATHYDCDELGPDGTSARIREYRIWSAHRPRDHECDVPSFAGSRREAINYLAEEWVEDAEDIL